MPRVARRYLNRTREREQQVAAQVEKPVLHQAFINVVEANIDHMQHLIYVTTAYVQDMQAANGETVCVYPADVAGLVGIGESRAGVFMTDLKRAGLIEGSAAAGYKLAEPK